ncbi:uncharacterized protein LOC133545634 isoform X2 [Nerophis ophidion]|uniref:uncharacterized protein LOC133545634 isoform X2 n=1 Tax=Nerophis ophidion TaxID=159077 RepID=UPI002AE00E1B|nr:uncharacterized protein LOC133545634 isoform X2 [Nerophis ophidion]
MASQAASPPAEANEHDYADTAAGEESAQAGVQRGRRRARLQEDKSCRCCCCCGGHFERQGRGFNRRAVFTFTTPDAARWVFPDAAAVTKKSFVCETCAQVIRTKCWRKNNGKRVVWLKPASAKQASVQHKKRGFRMGKKSKAALLVSKSCYKSAFRTLWSAKGARKPMMDFLSRELREEMKVLSRHADSPFHQKVSSKKLLSFFPWGRCLSWAQEHAPLITTCLSSMFPTVNALVKSSQNIWKNNFLQAALGAKLRLQGCSGAALDTLNSLGLCQNKDTVRLRLHRLHGGGKANGGQRLSEDQMADIEEDDVEDEEEDEEDEEQDAVREEEEMEKRRRKKRKREKQEEEEELEDNDEGSEQRKRRVVVVRLGLLKGHSEVGRSDLSAP